MPKALRLLRRAGVSGGQPGTVLACSEPTMPANLSPDEQAAWRGLLSELATVPGLVSQADRGVCELVARLEPAMRAAAVVVREHGPTIECRDKDGNVKFIQTRNEATFFLKAAALLKTSYAELGLTPSGRCRVSLSPARPASKLETFLEARKHGA